MLFALILLLLLVLLLLLTLVLLVLLVLFVGHGSSPPVYMGGGQRLRPAPVFSITFLGAVILSIREL